MTTSKAALRLTAAALLAWSVARPAAAAPIADGRFDPNEGYDVGYFLSFDVEGGPYNVPGGELWLHQGSGSLFAAFIQPVTLVDNTYGNTSIGWGKSSPSGKDHSFSSLVGSDSMEFSVTNGLGATVFSAQMDYISKVGNNYASLGVTGGDGKAPKGQEHLVTSWGTSLDYNFNVLGHVLTTNSPATDDNYTPNPNYPGWIFPVIYELEISNAAFGSSGFGEFIVGLVHDSPNKLGKNKVFPHSPTPIPEPSTMLFFGFGALGLLGGRRRRLAAEAASA